MQIDVRVPRRASVCLFPPPRLAQSLHCQRVRVSLPSLSAVLHALGCSSQPFTSRITGLPLGLHLARPPWQAPVRFSSHFHPHSILHTTADAPCQPGCSSQQSVSHSTIYPRYLSQFNSIAHSPAISFARFPYVWALSIPSCVALPPASGFVAPFLASLLVEIDVGDGCSYSASVCDCACYLNVLRHARGYAGSLCPLCQMCDSLDVSCHFLVAVLPFVARSCLVSAPVFVVVLASTLMTVIGVGKHGALTPQFCQTTRMRVMRQ